MQIQFLGAAGTVTGSCYFLTSDSGHSIFIDCGMFQGTKDLEKLNPLPFACNVSSAMGLVLTHSHLDHCGRLPLLLKQGFDAPMWMTPPTKEITEISLYDTAKIGMHDKYKTALYEKEDVEKTIGLFRTVEYEQAFTIGDFSITMRDAGHILGSASLEIVDNSAKSGLKKIVFSGDLGNTPQDLIQPTELINSTDVVIMESTYGDRTHPAEDPSLALQAEIQAVENSGGTLLIPAFSIERSQELLHKIFHLKQQGKVKNETPIIFDGPMGQKVTQVFEKYPEYYNTEFSKDFQNGSPFMFPGLNVMDKRDDSEHEDHPSGTKVIIAGSGMMTGGRIMSYAMHYLSQESTRLFIVGFQAEGTLGRILLDGAKTVHIQGIPVMVNATVSQTQAMSSHADQPKLMNWLRHIQGVKKVFLLHGEDVSRQVLAQKITADLGIADVQLPNMNQVVSL